MKKLVTTALCASMLGCSVQKEEKVAPAVEYFAQRCHLTLENKDLIDLRFTIGMKKLIQALSGDDLIMFIRIMENNPEFGFFIRTSIGSEYLRGLPQTNDGTEFLLVSRETLEKYYFHILFVLFHSGFYKEGFQITTDEICQVSL